MVLYNYDTNLILTTPFPNLQAATITAGCKCIHERLYNNGLAPTLHILDNECSYDMRIYFQKYQVKFELLPPHIHCRNADEQAIQTWKNHFLAAIASIDPALPIKEWDRLLFQSEITINILRSSRCHPKISAWAALFGPSPLAVGAGLV